MVPGNVRLHGRNVSVRTDSSKSKLLGQCTQNSDGSVSITLWDKGSRSAYSTLWHELLHAMSFHKNLRLTEKQVLGVERGLKSLCRNNPALMRKLVRKI